MNCFILIDVRLYSCLFLSELISIVSHGMQVNRASTPVDALDLNEKRTLLRWHSDMFKGEYSFLKMKIEVQLRFNFSENTGKRVLIFYGQSLRCSVEVELEIAILFFARQFRRTIRWVLAWPTSA